jgi:tetratricopeptide (TPR) repeat protein/peroxiredoxin
MKARGLVSRGRRDFLIRSCQWASAAFAPAGLGAFALPANLPLEAAPRPPEAAPQDNRLTPQYRLKPPLEDVLRKVAPGQDAFVTEKYASQIEVILAEWSSGLRCSSPDLQGIRNSLSEDFEASSLRPSQSQPLRPTPGLEVYRNRFSGALTPGQENFLQEFRAFVGPLSRILTAEFEVEGLSASSPLSASSGASTVIQTRVRYDLVGTGADFFRAQRVGYWDLEWASEADGQWRIRKWQALEETQSRAPGPVFVDITAQALGANRSYGEQMLRGVDYWRTVLDGACRIDVYGNQGVSAADVDNDGFDDFYVCQPAGLPNRLYRNRGDGTFEDITEAAGVGVLDNTPCALFADLDNDGLQDLIVVTVDGPLLFLNRPDEGGGCRFRYQPDAFRFAQPPQGTFTGAAVADYDRDGWLDVYFCLYSYYQGLSQYRYPTPYYDAQNGPPNFLMRNRGDGTFSDSTAAAGLSQNNNRYSFACAWTDYDGDGWPDLYVANDFGRKNLYRNNRNGTFTDVAREAGVEDVGAGMSVCWFDYDNDGWQDLYVADMWSAAGRRTSAQEVFLKDAPAEVRAQLRKHARGNSLFRNRGDGGFADASASAGVEMGRWAWSSEAWDFDHDGYPDLYIANGMISGPDRRDLSSFFWRQVAAETPLEARPAHRYEQGWNAVNELIRADGTWAGYQRSNFYANNREGTFSDVSGAVGLDLIEDSRAFALADFDHDGRLELVLKNRSAPQLRILRTEMRSLGASIAFRLRGRQSNRDAIGASITVEAGQLRQTKFLQAGSGFLSQRTKELFFGLGEAAGPVRASVRWPSGLVQHFENLAPGNRILIEEGSSRFGAEPFASGAAAMGSARERAGAPEVAVVEPSPSASETWLLAPLAAPNFSLPDVAGRVHTLASFRGRPLLLNFWATWSPPSAQQLRLFHHRPSGSTAARLQLLALSVNAPGEAGQVRAFARDHGFRFPVLLASADTLALYNILSRYLFDRRRDLGLPTSFLVDARGSIVKVYQGPVEPEQVEGDSRRIPSSAAERARLGLPFPGDWYGGGVRRNQFTYTLAYLERGYPDQALASCRLVLQDDPENAEAYYLLGSIYLQKQMRTEAREGFQRTLQLRPSYPDTWTNAWNNLGMMAAQDGQAADAVQYLQKALEANPHHLVALENLGNVYRQQGQWKEAQAALELALQADPDDPEANYSLGMVFAQQDDTQRAYEYLHKALVLRPDYPEALNNLGVLYLRTRRVTKAIESFESCIRLAPSFDQSYLNLAKVYEVEGEVEKARSVLRQLLQQHPGHALAQQALAELKGRTPAAPP